LNHLIVLKNENRNDYNIIKYLFDVLITKVFDRLTELISGYVAHMHVLSEWFFFQNHSSE